MPKISIGGKIIGEKFFIEEQYVFLRVRPFGQRSAILPYYLNEKPDYLSEEPIFA